MDISIEKFYDKFTEMYEFLYDNYDRVAGYSEALEEFDDFLSKHTSFVVEFAKYRGRMIFGDDTFAQMVYEFFLSHAHVFGRG